MEFGKTIVKMQFGSHVYGTNLPTSDLDFKAVHIPSAEDILLQRVRNTYLEKTNTSTERNTSEDTDFESFSLQQFMKLLLEGQTMALDMLFTPERWIVQSSGLWEKIVSHRESWLHSGVSAFVGYCRQQANKYGVRGSRVAVARAAVQFLQEMQLCWGGQSRVASVWSEVERFAAEHEHAQIVVGTHSDGREVRMLEVCGRKIQEHVELRQAEKVYQLILDTYGQRALQAEQNQGVDWKALCHAVRVLHEAQELLTTGHITFPRPEADLLLQIRKGEMTYAHVADIIECGMAGLDELMASSKLPKEPDKAKAENLVLDVYALRVGSASVWSFC